VAGLELAGGSVETLHCKCNKAKAVAIYEKQDTNFLVKTEIMCTVR
jgi:hypothetical protein